MATSVELVQVSNVNLDTAVLVDGQTVLSTRPEYFTCPASERDTVRDDPDRLMTLYNFIQNLIIYDCVLVDSQLLVLENGCENVCSLFEGAISGLLIDGKLRADLADEVTRLVSSADLDEVKLDKQNAQLIAEIADNDAADTQQYYSQLSGGWLRDDVAMKLRKQASLLGETLEEFIPRMTMFTAGTCDRSLERTHFYLELSRALGVYLSPHPKRAEYFKRTVRETFGPKNRFAADVVEFVDKNMRGSKSDYFLNARWDLPPVAEYVLRVADNRDMDLVSAILEVRESKHAQAFRRWCEEMSGTLRQGRGSMAAAQRVYE